MNMTGPVSRPSPATECATFTFGHFRGLSIPKGASTSVYLQCGPSASSGFTTASQSYPGGQHHDLSVCGHSRAGSEYDVSHFRLMREPTMGRTSFGNDRTFTTPILASPGINSPGTATRNSWPLSYVYQVTATNGPAKLHCCTGAARRGLSTGEQHTWRRSETHSARRTIQFHFRFTWHGNGDVDANLVQVCALARAQSVTSGTYLCSQNEAALWFQVSTTNASPAAHLSATGLPQD